MRPSCHGLDRLAVTFDDDHAVAGAGLLLPATLAQHLGLRDLFDAYVDLGDVPGRSNVGIKAMTLVLSALAGGDCIDDAGQLRSASTVRVLGQPLRAPSTLGTFLRGFSWGHVLQLDKVLGEALARAWSAGAGPGDGPLTIDVDSTITQTYGLKKQGGRFGYTHVRGYDSLLAMAAGTDQVLGVRLRAGNAHTGRGAASFLSRVFNRVRRAGATGPVVLRADSGFYSSKVTEACDNAGVAYSLTAKMFPALYGAITAIGEEQWSPIPYWIDGGADVAEIAWRPFSKHHTEARLIVRRVKPSPGSQLALLDTYDYHAFLTNRVGDLVGLEADHRRHAVCEEVIKDLKYGVGLNHMPSGRFAANAAWLVINAIAHNISRWLVRIGLGPGAEPITTKTVRTRFLSIPGRVTTSARRFTLHMPAQWPWRDPFEAMICNLRALQLSIPSRA